MVPPKLDIPLLGLPAGQAAQVYALVLLDKATATGERLTHRDDTEALHDFRVALRRLRSWLRAYGRHAGIGKKYLRRLKGVAAITNRARDAEVGLAWLATQRSTLPERQLAGLNHFAAHLEEEKERAYEFILTHVPAEWAVQADKLRKRLSRELHITSQNVFAEVAREQVLACRDQLASRIDLVQSPEDITAAHRARISAKRLRYLLEPLCGEVPDAVPVVKMLAGVQDQLGELHDASVMLYRLIEATESAAMEDAKMQLALVLKGDLDENMVTALMSHDTQSGLLILAHRGKWHETAVFNQILLNLHTREVQWMLDEVRHLGESLAGLNTDDIGAGYRW
jgi:CHAD domain-containing protein